MPEAKPTDFTEEFHLLNGEGVKEERLEPVEVAGNTFSSLNFDTVIQHLRRNGYNVDVSPNGASKDLVAEADTKKFDISKLQDEAYQVEFSIEVDEIEKRSGDKIEDPEAYVENVYGQIIGELVEREKKLERASENYVSNVFENEEDSIDGILKDFQKHGDAASDVINSYFGDMRPSELAMNYAVHFELHQGENVDNERRNLPGKMPLCDALNHDDFRNRNSLYFRRYLGKVLEKADRRGNLNEELREYWPELE